MYTFLTDITTSIESASSVAPEIEVRTSDGQFPTSAAQCPKLPLYDGRPWSFFLVTVIFFPTMTSKSPTPPPPSHKPIQVNHNAEPISDLSSALPAPPSSNNLQRRRSRALPPTSSSSIFETLFRSNTFPTQPEATELLSIRTSSHPNLASSTSGTPSISTSSNSPDSHDYDHTQSQRWWICALNNNPITNFWLTNVSITVPGTSARDHLGTQPLSAPHRISS